MRFIYFLTIDKVTLDGAPTKKQLLKIRNEICKKAELQTIQPYQVQCFEYKDKGIKAGRYLHYHCLLSSKKTFIPYALISVKGYSLKLIKMKTFFDLFVCLILPLL